MAQDLVNQNSIVLWTFPDQAHSTASDKFTKMVKRTLYQVGKKKKKNTGHTHTPTPYYNEEKEKIYKNFKTCVAKE